MAKLSGIYSLYFEGNLDKVYIGRSVDIIKRIQGHRKALLNGLHHSRKLQEAYMQYQVLPAYVVLEEAEEEVLNSLELQYIREFDAVNNGYNMVEVSPLTSLPGELNPNAKYSLEDYLQVLTLLVSSNMTKREIAELTGVSVYTIRHIAALESHTYLLQTCPDLYKKLVEIKENNPYSRKRDYGILISPDGIELPVTHITNFCKAHGLLQPKISEVLKGIRTHHKGWVRKVSA
jgi:Trp operon repressor